MSHVSMPVEQVILSVEQICASMHLPYEIKADAMLDYATDSLLLTLKAHIWGEKRTSLVQVPDGFAAYVKHHVRRWKHTPQWIRKRLTVRYIDWEAIVFRAYPDFEAPKLHGRMYDRHVIHVMHPLNLTELSR